MPRRVQGLAAERPDGRDRRQMQVRRGLSEGDGHGVVVGALEPAKGIAGQAAREARVVLRGKVGHLPPRTTASPTRHRRGEQAAGHAQRPYTTIRPHLQG
eukprot:4460586-Alexandrium_andersonii.AAC.1